MSMPVTFALPSGFHFTSIQLNKNYLSAMHVDKGNAGPSYIVGLGNFEGGNPPPQTRPRLGGKGR